MRSERLRCSGFTADPSHVFSLMKPGSPRAAATAIRNDPESTLVFPGRRCGTETVMKRRLLPFALLVALAAPPAALTSVTVTTNARRPSLRVDSRGYAEVGWTAAGVRRTLLIPPRGQAYPGG